MAGVEKALAAGRRWRPRRLAGGCGLALFGVFLVLALAAPVLAPDDPDALDLGHRLAGISLSHPLGTDTLGRDQLSRLMHGGRAALTVGLLAVGGSILLALVVGGTAGYFGGWLDLGVSALLNVLLTLPGLLLTLAILGIVGTGPLGLLLALIGGEWAGQARIVRASVLAAREQGYVESARAIGAPRLYVLGRHILPNIAGTVAVLATLDLAGVLLTISGLSFLGLGVQPPQADWGTMITDSRPYALSYPGLLLQPTVCLVLFAVAANLAGDALRDLFDPHQR